MTYIEPDNKGGSTDPMLGTPLAGRTFKPGIRPQIDTGSRPEKRPTPPSKPQAVEVSNPDAEAFLLLLNPDKDYKHVFALQAPTTFDEEGKEVKGKWHDHPGTWDECKGYVTQKSAQGYQVYVAINTTDDTGLRNDTNVTGVTALVIDFDHKERYETTACHLEPSFVVHSHGGDHLYWLIDPADSSRIDDFKPAQKRLIAHYNSDPSINNLARVMRLPGFNHLKDPSAPYMVTLEVVSGKRYTFEEVLAALPEPVKVPATRATRAATATPTSVEALLTQLSEAPPKTRNNELNRVSFQAALLVMRAGGDLDALRDTLTEIALEIGQTPNEAEETIDSGFKAAAIEALKPVPADKESSQLKLIRIFEEEFLPHLDYDVLGGCYRLSGEPITVEKLRNIIVKRHNINVNITDLAGLLSTVASDKPFYAPAAYLRALPPLVEGAHPIADLCKALGIDDVLGCIYIEKFLVSAVARAMKPGSKVDTALVLKGAQGIGKTSLFQALFGEWFITVSGIAKDKDDLLNLYRCWCAEVGELDHCTSRQAVGAIKADLSKTDDMFRAPYARAPEKRERHFVHGGSTNEAQFLNDTTGARRFWVLELTQNIPIVWVKENRDYIWAEALALYESGEAWWLTDTEQQLSNQANEEYQLTDAWDELVEKYVRARVLTADDCIKVDDVLETACEVPKSQRNNPNKSRVSKILTRLGLDNTKPRKINGKTVRGFFPTDKYWLSEQEEPQPLTW